MSKRRKNKIEKGALVRCGVICIAVAAISFSLIPGLAAQGTDVSVNITVNAPEFVEGTFNASVDVANVTDFNSGEFDLTFNSSVVNVTEIKGGKIDGKAVPIFNWDFIDAETVKVLIKLPGAEGANGSGNLAEIEFQVKGKNGDKSKLDISNGLLSDTSGVKEIDAEWYDAEVTVGAAGLPNMTMTVTPGTIQVSVPTLVTINITDEHTGAPINGAIVTISKLPYWPGESNTTFNGLCSFTVTSNYPGSIDVDATAPGYNDTSAELIVAAGPTLAWEIEPPTSAEQGDNVTFDICFSEPASYVVSIKNSSGLVVTSWSGTEKDPGPMAWTTTTSDMPGDYTIEITIDDVVVATRTVTVTEPIERVPVTVSAPEYVEKGGTFVAIINVDSVTDLNSAQFDLTFNSSVVNVTDVKEGKINGVAVPIFDWHLSPDNDTARVIIMMPIGTGVSGSGYLAEVEFEVTGDAGEKSELMFSNGELVDSEAKEIATKWIGAEVTVK
jgi:hypothetical protein